MPTPSLFTRLRRATEENRSAIAALALSAVAIGLLWSTQAAVATDRSFESTPAPDAWREVGEFRYQVPVSNASDAYPAGTVLGMGEPGYFETVSPQFLVDFHWSTDGPGSQRGIAYGSLQVIVQGADGRTWRVAQEIANATRVASDARPLSLSGTVDLPSMERTLAEAGHAGDNATWKVLARVAFATKDGATISNSEFHFDINRAAPLYLLPQPEALTTSAAHGEPRVTIHETRAGVSGVERAPAGPILALAGIAGLVLVARTEDTA